MSKHIQQLEDYEITLANWQELSDGEYQDTVEEFQLFYYNHGDYFTQYEFDIYNRADMLIGEAEDYYNAIAYQEQLDMWRDERSYLRSECNS